MLNAPDPEVERLIRAAMQAFNAGNRDAAKAAAQQVLLRQPTQPVARQILGVVALDRQDFAAARGHFETASKAAPGPVISNLLGLALRGLDNIVGARAAFKQAGEGGLIDGWRNLGHLEQKLGASGAAIAAYQHALALAPDDPGAHAALSHLHEVRHDLLTAKQHALTALNGDPNNDTARTALARVLLREKSFTGAEAAAAPLAMSPQANPDHRAIALGIIGDARDRAGDVDGAFAAFSQANAILLQINAHWLNEPRRLYHPTGVRSMTEFVAGTDISTWRKPSSFTTPAPVFLVGFPRSGTTLLDQILSSHSGIVCLEEREHLSAALSIVFEEPSRLPGMGLLSDEEIARVREHYWQRVREETALPDRGLVVDKFPLNIVVLPLIRAVFPDAKIIFALRDPRDVVLSCFQQRFGMNAAMAQFLELGSAAGYYDLVMRLFELCRERLGLSIHQVRYEDVVADLERAARSLTAFLGVPFEPAMLRFQETALKREIATPSARQVTQPLYARSVGRWKRYERHLQPVLPLLDVWAQRLGYEP